MKNKKAFSLVEAMVILLLISIAIMVLIPLISQKNTMSRWKPVKENTGDITTISYGDEPVERVGIGADPYDAPVSKLAVGSLGITTGSIPATSILWNDYYVDSIFAKTNNHTKSIVLGVNSTVNTANTIIDSSIVIKSNGAPTAPTYPVEIGSNIIVDNNDTLTIKSGANTLVSVSDTDFAFNYLDNSDPDNTVVNQIMAYSGDILQIGNSSNEGNLSIGTTGTGTITVGTASGVTVDSSNPSSCTPLFKDSVGNTYCDWASNQGFTRTTSDKRLKNIISKYEKSQTELDKIDTYKFNYKSDKKKRMHTGVIAQKLIGIFDEALHIDDKGYYSIEREPILYAMINSAKDFMNEYKNTKKTQQKNIKKADKLLRKYQ